MSFADILNSQYLYFKFLKEENECKGLPYQYCFKLSLFFSLDYYTQNLRFMLNIDLKIPSERC